MQINTQKSQIPEVGEGKRGEDGHLGYLLRQAANAFRGNMEVALQDSSLTSPQFLVLTMIEAYPGASNADLARLTMLTPQTVSVIVANLEKSGDILRRPHHQHGRIVHLDMTVQGTQNLRQAKHSLYDFENQLAAGFDEAELAVVKRWLVAVAKQKTV